MTTFQGNLFAPLPAPADQEHLDTLCVRPGVRIERIVSHGQSSPPEEWFDQAEDEWVCLLVGEARLAFDGGGERALRAGDWLMIPAHRRHRVLATSAPAVWLAVFVPPADGDTG